MSKILEKVKNVQSNLHLDRYQMLPWFQSGLRSINSRNRQTKVHYFKLLVKKEIAESDRILCILIRKTESTVMKHSVNSIIENPSVEIRIVSIMTKNRKVLSRKYSEFEEPTFSK